MRGTVDGMASEGIEAVRSEEELVVERGVGAVGGVRARKVVEEERVERLVPRGIEHADVERVPAAGADSGQIETLPDGSVSIPVFEEELVIEKRLVVRERIVIRKRTVTEENLVEAHLKRERIEIEADPEVADRVVDARSTP